METTKRYLEEGIRYLKDDFKYEYDVNGKLIHESLECKIKNLSYEKFYIYDHNGLLLYENTNYYDHSEMKLYTYNKDNMLIAITDCKFIGKIDKYSVYGDTTLEITSFMYDDRNNLIRQKTKKVNSFKISDKKEKYKFTYNNNNQKVYEVKKDYSYNTKIYTTYLYDEEGALISETQNCKSWNATTTYSYCDNKFNKNTVSHIHHEYNQYDHKVIDVLDMKYSYSVDTGLLTKMSSVETFGNKECLLEEIYEYDANNNLIHKSVYTQVNILHM